MLPRFLDFPDDRIENRAYIMKFRVTGTVDPRNDGYILFQGFEMTSFRFGK